jgi:hypothetical protein
VGELLAKFGIGGGIGFLLGLMAVWWIAPTTAGGTVLLVAIFVIASAVLGGIVSPLFGNKETSKHAIPVRKDGGLPKGKQTTGASDRPMASAPPKVFISYSHDSVEHQERVVGLADRLRADGIDAEVDQYNAAPPEGWPLWCERQIEAAEFVLMVCTESYHRRVKGDEQPGQGLGVVWEAGIIRQLLYDAGALSDKFVPVLFSDGVVEYVPTLIRGRTRYVVDTEDGYERLLRQLSGQPSVVRPVLGPMPPLPTRPRQWPADEPPPASATPPGERTVTASGAGSVAVGGGAGGATIVTGSYNTDGKGAR